MTRISLSVLVVSAILALSACGSSDIPAGVSDSDKETLTKAFAKADKGENPVMTCAVLAGKATGYADHDKALAQKAMTALETCYVDVRLRYFDAVLKQADKSSACMTIYSSTQIWRMSLGSMGAEQGMDTAALDKRVADAMEPRLKGVCDDFVLEGLRGQ